MIHFQIENLVAIELAYINTKHPDFNKDAAFASVMLKEVDMEQKRKHLSSNSISNAIVPFDKVSCIVKEYFSGERQLSLLISF